MLFQAGNSLGGSGQVTQAITHFQHLIVGTTTHLGPDHPDALTTRHNLAHWGERSSEGPGTRG